MDDIIKNAADRFSTFLAIHMSRLEDKGYSREEIVALDFDEEAVVFYMTSGDIIRIPKTSLSLVDEDKSTLH